MEAVFYFLQQYIRGQLFLINVVVFILLKALLAWRAGEGRKPPVSRHTLLLFFSGVKGGGVCKQLLLL